MKLFSFFFILLLHFQLYGQQQNVRSADEIYAAIEKLGVLANVLYVAAHPDDENTRMISYLANDVKANTRYLSLTRGDGGQNLIGPEIKELLGVIRTQELLAARKIDGGSQMFSRANDFGYSKTAEETIEIWDDKKVLSDVVWAIRTFRPDIVINRFDHESSGRTHGHHTASAMLSFEAYDMAGDKTAFPDQLEYTSTWQPTRLFWNTSWWHFGGKEAFEKVDKSKFLSVDIGSYYPHKAMSNNEMAAYSRSMHKCQGMGNTPERGSQMEYLKLLKGEMPSNKSDLFDGIDISWTRVENGATIKSLWEKVLSNYDFRNPEASIPELLNLRKAINVIKDPYWRKLKLQEIDAIIQDAAGLFIESNAEKNLYIPGEEITLNTEIVSRLAKNIELVKVEYLGLNADTSTQVTLLKNEKVIFENEGIIPRETATTAPYWLKEKGTLGMYKVEDQELIGNPETARAFRAKYYIRILDTELVITKDVTNKYTDPERGEVYRPVEVIEEFYVSPQHKVFVFDGEDSKELALTVKGMLPGAVEVHPNLPESWKSTPVSQTVKIDQAGGEVTVRFKITPPKQAEKVSISPYVIYENKKYQNELIKIDYEHIPLQHVAIPAEVEMVNLNITTRNEHILYIEGAGDEIPQSLRQIGYQVDVVQPEDIEQQMLESYDAVILGIRAYNKSEALKYKQDILFEYVAGGGNFIVQYNTTWRRKVDEIGPYPIQLSRDRVSVETAPVTFLAPDHAVLNHPNKITQEDFNNWVQERGLYFADEWDERYTAILSAHDPGEEPKHGGLLIAKHGEGHFIFTGYSWFRQLPAGVPGAFRIFANMISL